MMIVNKHGNRRGFTLIELLVVITIISLLIAILLPSLRSARVAAQATQSLSQARQVNFALVLYANDWKSTLPYGRDNVPTSSSGSYWPGLVYHGNYVNKIELFWGPGRTYNTLNLSTMKTNYNTWHWRYVGYGANYNGAMAAPSFGLPFRLDIGKTPPSSKHVLLSEVFRTAYYYSIPSVHNPATPDGISSIGPDANNTMFTHNKKLIRTYVDGHGSMRTGEDLGWFAVDARSGSWDSLANVKKSPWYDMRYPNDWD